MRLLSDQIRCISPTITFPEIPHIDITGVLVDAKNDKDVINAWTSELKAAASIMKPFRLELGKPIKLQGHEQFSDNVSFPVPILNSQAQVLSEIIVSITHKHFPGLPKRGLKAHTPHMCIVENIPEHLQERIDSEAAKFSSTISFDVDRIWLATVEEDRVLRDSYYFATKITDEDVQAYVPDDGQAQWLLASMYIHQKPFDSRLRLQKVMFLEDQEIAKSYYLFKPNRLGPHSHYLQDWCNKMIAAGLAYETKQHVIGLTPLGEKVAANCFGFMNADTRLRLVRWMKENGSKSTNELLNYVHYVYPEYHMLERHYPDD